MSLSNPLNVLLIPPILYLAYRLVFPSWPSKLHSIPDSYSEDQYNWLPAKHPEVLCYQKYNPSDLAKHHGKDGGRILLAIMRIGRDGKVPAGGKAERTVFDVTTGRSFYGPGKSTREPRPGPST
jgi:membrane-associated progesterone receptor component